MVKHELEFLSLKTLREDLCVAMSALTHYSTSADPKAQLSRVKRLDDMVKQIDILRPLGPDGKHKNRHTEFCGCEVPDREVNGTT